MKRIGIGLALITSGLLALAYVSLGESDRLTSQSSVSHRHTGPVTTVSFSLDGQWLASGSLDHTIQIVKVATGKLLHSLRHGAEVYVVEFSPDGRHLASAGQDGRVLLWSTSSGELVHLFERSPDWSVAIAFSKDSSLLAVGSQSGSVFPYDVRSGKLMSSFNPSIALRRISSVSFSGDGKYLAAAKNDIVIWNAHSKKRGEDIPGSRVRRGQSHVLS